MTSEPQPTVGFIGLGAMGSRMASNVAAAGFEMICFDAAGTEARAPAGAGIAANVGAVAVAADVIIFSLPNGDISASFFLAIRRQKAGATATPTTAV